MVINPFGLGYGQDDCTLAEDKQTVGGNKCRWHIMNHNVEVAYFDVDEEHLYIDNYKILVAGDETLLPFHNGVVKPDFVDLLEFLNKRGVSGASVGRAALTDISQVIEAIHATHGVLRDDYQWIRFDNEDVVLADVDMFERRL